MQKVDLTGRRFGHLLVLKLGAPTYCKRTWLCVCDCGNKRQIITASLTQGKTVSCGCARTARIAVMNKTHGLSKHSAFSSWSSMFERCYNPNNKNYAQYGQKNITVCARWLKVENFIADMGERPKGKTLDRINFTLGYTPENCQWATKREQTLNRAVTVWVSLRGKIFCLRDAEKELNLSRGTPWHYAAYNGKSIQEAVNRYASRGDETFELKREE